MTADKATVEGEYSILSGDSQNSPEDMVGGKGKGKGEISQGAHGLTARGSL